ncbi:MAG: DUF4249 domain-containing protein [Muribaculaceae bacterium]|nr:DUF4249 domain-containing protein [Muribaculaceae bacterium]
MRTIFKKNSLILLTYLMFLSSCYTNFEPDIKSNPVVCINSLLTAGEKINVEVTRTWRYTEGTPTVGLDISLKEAEVYLYVNDELEERLVLRFHSEDGGGAFWSRPNGVDCYFAAQYIPKSGDKIKIIAKDKNYGEAYAEVTIPYPVEIDDVETRITKLNSSFTDGNDTYNAEFDMMLSVKFTDPISISNYYIFDMQTGASIRQNSEDGHYQPSVESVRINPDYGFEPLFSEHITPLETIITDAYGLYTVFSDRQISGKQYNLEVPLSGSYFCNYSDHPGMDQKLLLNVEFGHITKAYYNYMMSLWANTEGISGALGGVGLGDAVFEFSNVSTGAGIVAAKANSIYELDIREIINQHIKND